MIVTEGFLEEVGPALGFEECVGVFQVARMPVTFTLGGQLISWLGHITIAKLELASIIIGVGWDLRVYLELSLWF